MYYEVMPVGIWMEGHMNLAATEGVSRHIAHWLSEHTLQ